MKTLTLAVLIIAIHAGASARQCTAADLNARVLFADDFSRSGDAKDEIGLGWNTVPNEWAFGEPLVAVSDGHLRFLGKDSTYPGFYRYTEFVRGRVLLRFQLTNAADQLSIALRDNLLVEVPNGNLFSMDVHPAGIRMLSCLRDGSSTVTNHDMVIAAGQWQSLQIAVNGEKLRVTLENQPPIEMVMAAMKRTKSELRLTAAGGVSIDDLQITSTDPPYDLNSLPTGLVVTKRAMRTFDQIGASDDQKSRLRELIAAHRGYVYTLREQAGFTNTGLIGKRDEAVQEARQLGLQGDAIWDHLQERAELSDLQREAFRITFERHNQFRAESSALLTDEQQKLAAQSKPKREKRTQ